MSRFRTEPKRRMERLVGPVFFIIFTLLFFCSLTLTTSSVFAVVDPECKPDGVSPERDPRPASCNICNITDLLTPSCATTFKTLQEVEYERGGPETIKWDGTIYIDPTEIKIPFVGMKNKESAAWWEISNASENDYLADYLEGTNEYYRNYGNLTTITNYQGVLRKLTPFEYQNQLKKQLITRAQEKEIHDYSLKYIGRFCWDVPFWMDAGKFVFEKLGQLATDLTINKVLAFFSGLFNFEKTPQLTFDLPDIGHYCLYASLQEGIPGWFVAKTDNFIQDAPVVGDIYNGLIKFTQIPGLVHLYHSGTIEENLSSLAAHQPPDPNEENYQEKYLAWKESGPEDGKEAGYWYRLWQATPMLSREDTKGTIEPYLGPDAEAELGEIPEENLIEKVPHLARLYEGSKIISDLLTPVGEEGKMIEMVKTPEIVHTNPPFACFKENYLPGPEGKGDELCCQSIETQLSGKFTNPYYPCDRSATDSACQKTEEKDVSQDIGINLKHPYLDEIWSFTTNAKGGFFNIFRPYGVSAFEDIDAADTISYSYSKGDVSPQQGLFYFPHLGGIQKAKEYVVNQALWPYKAQ